MTALWAMAKSHGRKDAPRAVVRAESARTKTIWVTSSAAP